MQQNNKRFSSAVGLSSNASAALQQPQQPQQPQHPHNKSDHEVTSSALGPTTDHLPNSSLNLAQAILVYDSNWRPGSSSGSRSSASHTTPALPAIPTIAPKLKSRGYIAEGTVKETEAIKVRVSSASTSRSKISTTTVPPLSLNGTRSTEGKGVDQNTFQQDATQQQKQVPLQASNTSTITSTGNALSNAAGNGTILYGNDWGWGLPPGSTLPMLDLPAGGGASAVALNRARRAQTIEDATASSSTHAQRMIEPHHPVVIQRPSSAAIRGFSVPVVRPGSALFAYSQPMPKPQAVTNELVKKHHPNHAGGVTRIKEYNRLADSLNQALTSYAEAAVHAHSLPVKDGKKGGKKHKKSTSKEESEVDMALFKTAQQSAQTNASTRLQAQLLALQQQIAVPTDPSLMQVSDFSSIMQSSQLPSSSSSSFGGSTGQNSQYVYSLNPEGIQTIVPMSLFVHQQQQNDALQRLLEQQHALQQQQLHQQMQQQMQQQIAIQQQQVQQQQLLELQHRKQMMGVETSFAVQSAQMREKLNIVDPSNMQLTQTFSPNPSLPIKEAEEHVSPDRNQSLEKPEINTEAVEIASAEAQRKAETVESEKLAREAALKLEELQRSQRRFSTTVKPKIELRHQPSKAIPPSPLPVDKRDEQRANELSRAALISRASTSVIQVGRTKAGSPVTSFMDHPAWPTLISAASATGASLQWAEATIKAWQVSVLNEALCDNDVSQLISGMPPELKHAYPTRLLLSLVKDLCDEVSASPPVDAPSHVQKLYASSGPPISSPYPNQPVKVSFSADLPSAWLWFLQLARDLRSCWASGTAYAQSKRSERIKKSNSNQITDNDEEVDEEEDEEKKSEIKPTTNRSSRRRDKTLYSSVRSDSYICATASAAALSKTISERETALATELLSVNGISNSNSDVSYATLLPPLAEPLTEEEILAVTEAAAESAEAVLEPFGEVVQEDHILRLLRRVPMPTVTASTLFARTALAFAGWGSLNDAAATVMRTFLEEMRPQAKGLDREAAAESIKKSADAVERDMAIVEAALLEPITLCSPLLLATYTESGVRVGPGGFITPSSARAMVVQPSSVAQSTMSMSGPPSVTQYQHQQQSGSPLHSSALQRILTSGGSNAQTKQLIVSSSDVGFSPSRIQSGYDTPTNATSPNPHYGSASLFTSVAPSRRGSLTGSLSAPRSRPSSAAAGRSTSDVGNNGSTTSVSAALASAPIVDGVRILTVFDAHSWATLLYVRTRTCASSALDSLFSTPTEALSLHYAFVRQCLATPPKDDDIRAAAEIALSRTVMGRSPMGSFKSFDPVADKEDSEEITQLFNLSKILTKRNRSPMRHYYPTRYLLSLVRTLVAHISTPIDTLHDRYSFINSSTIASPVIESSDPISIWQVRTAWIFFLQLRRAMDITWASAFCWHSKASQSEEGSSPRTKSEKYVPFGELVQMDLILRLLERLSLLSIASKVLFVRTALAFCGWGSLEDASATIIRSHLEETASDAKHDREVLEGRMKERALRQENRAQIKEQKRLRKEERLKRNKLAEMERIDVERRHIEQAAEELAVQRAIQEMEATEREVAAKLEMEASHAKAVKHVEEDKDKLKFDQKSTNETTLIDTVFDASLLNVSSSGNETINVEEKENVEKENVEAEEKEKDIPALEEKEHVALEEKVIPALEEKEPLAMKEIASVDNLALKESVPLEEIAVVEETIVTNESLPELKHVVVEEEALLVETKEHISLSEPLAEVHVCYESVLNQTESLESSDSELKQSVVVDTSSLPSVSLVVAAIESKIAEQQQLQQQSPQTTKAIAPDTQDVIVDTTTALIATNTEIQIAQEERQQLLDVETESLAVAAHVTEQIERYATIDKVTIEPVISTEPVIITEHITIPTEAFVLNDPVVEHIEPIVSKDLVVTTEPVSDVVEPVVDAVERVSDAVGPVSDVVEPIVDSVKPVSDVVEPVIDAVEPVVDSVESVSDVVEPVVDAVEPVVDSVEPVVDSVEPVVDSVEPVVDSVEPAVNSVEPIVDTVEPVVDSVEPIVDTVEPIVDVVEPAIYSAAINSAAIEPVAEAINAVVKDLVSVNESVLSNEPVSVSSDLVILNEPIIVATETVADAIEPVVSNDLVSVAPEIVISDKPIDTVTFESQQHTLHELLLDLFMNPLGDGVSCAVVDKVVALRKVEGKQLESDGASDLLVQFGNCAMSLHESVGEKFNSMVADSLRALFYSDGYTEEGLLSWFLTLDESATNGPLEVAAAPIVNEIEELKSNSTHKVRAGMFDVSSGRNGSYELIDPISSENIEENTAIALENNNEGRVNDENEDDEEEEEEDNKEEEEEEEVIFGPLPPIVDLDACMKIAEATLTSGVKLLPWEQSRAFGGGGIRVRPGIIIGVSDVSKSVKLHNHLPESLYVNTPASHDSYRNQKKNTSIKKKIENNMYAGIDDADVASGSSTTTENIDPDELTRSDLFGPSAWSHLSYAKERTSQVDNLEVISTTPQDVLTLHYAFLKQCIKSPERFDKAAFEAAEAQAELDALKSTTKSNTDLSLLLTDKSGSGGLGASPLLTQGIRNEVSSLLGHSAMRSAAAASISGIKSLPTSILPQSAVSLMEKAATNVADVSNQQSPSSLSISSGELGLALDRAIAATDASHPGDLDKRKIKVLFLAAKDDGRTPIADPKTGQPVLVRASMSVEDSEMIFATLSRHSRRTNY